MLEGFAKGGLGVGRSTWRRRLVSTFTDSGCTMERTIPIGREKYLERYDILNAEGAFTSQASQDLPTLNLILSLEPSLASWSPKLPF
jgi:hypothetical protein